MSVKRSEFLFVFLLRHLYTGSSSYLFFRKRKMKAKEAHGKLVWFCVHCNSVNTLSKWDRWRLEQKKRIDIKCSVCGQRGRLKLTKEVKMEKPEEKKEETEPKKKGRLFGDPLVELESE